MFDKPNILLLTPLMHFVDWYTGDTQVEGLLIDIQIQNRSTSQYWCYVFFNFLI